MAPDWGCLKVPTPQEKNDITKVNAWHVFDDVASRRREVAKNRRVVAVAATESAITPLLLGKTATGQTLVAVR